MLLRDSKLVRQLMEDSEGEQSLNLAPVMNLFVILIPFLLISASFVQYSVVQTPAPVSGGPSAEKSKLPTLSFLMNKKQWQLQVQYNNGRMNRYRFKSGEYQKLIERLGKFKKRFPKLNQVFLKSGRGVVYNDVIRLIDVLRGEPPAELEMEKQELFSEVVFGDIM